MLLLHSLTSKVFFGKILATFELLSIVFEIKFLVVARTNTRLRYLSKQFLVYITEI